jgi:hypothetical protein
MCNQPVEQIGMNCAANEMVGGLDSVRCMVSVQELLGIRVLWDGVQLAEERCTSGC